MDYEEYRELYNSLRNPSDLEKHKGRYDDRLLDTLFTQKTSRDVKKRFYTVKQKTPRMMKDWQNGLTLVEVADKYKFPPILVSMFIFQEDGYNKKDFWSIIHDPSQLEDERVADEIRDVIAYDIVYSPEANIRQKERGIWGEDLTHQWLDGQGITYRTENDLRGTEFTKTPDCLLDKPVMYKGHKICWVESKASFGDNTEFKFNSRKQLIPYTQLFGPGLVVYWVGCLDDLECPPDVYVSDISVLDLKLEEYEEEQE